MPRKTDLHELVGLIYEAATEPAAWPRFLERCSDAVSGVATHLIFQDVSAKRGSIVVLARCDPGLLREYHEYYCQVNTYLTSRKHALSPGTVGTTQMYCEESELLGSEYYNDYVRRYDVFRLIGAVVLREGSWMGGFATMRSRRTADWCDEEVSLVQTLMPHLQRALRIHRHLDGLYSLGEAAAAALDTLQVGVVLLDQAGRILATNRTAREIADENDGLRLSRDGLETARPAETAALRRLVWATAQAANGGDCEGAGGALSLPRPSLRRPLALLVAPLSRGRFRWSDRSAAVVVFVTDPERRTSTPPELLQRLYGLTPAEGALASLLLEGLSLENAAEQRRTRVETARDELKSVFAKTNTHTQSQLMKLLLTGVGRVRAATSGNG